MALFRKQSADSASSASTSSSSSTDPSAKGRATPSRKQAEAERKERLRASARGEGTKGRPAAKGGSKDAQRAARADARKRMLAGDESAMTDRDRGPERRWARDLVDSQRTIGEYFLYIAIVILLLGVVRVPAIKILSEALLVAVVIALIIDALRIHRAASRGLAEKFPNGRTHGVARYAVMRSMVTRRMRAPKPQVERGAQVK